LVDGNIKDGGISAHLADEPFRLGDFNVDPKRLRIEQAGQSVKVEFKVMQVLLVLAHDAGEVVSRQTLEAAAWAGRIVTEDAVTNAVAKLRRAFGDSARAPTYIETVSKQGYRLMRKPEHPESKSLPKRLSHPLRRIHLAGGLAAAVIIAIFLGRPTDNEPAGPEFAIGMPPEGRSAAVSPPDSRLEASGDGRFAKEQGTVNTLAAYDEFLLGLAAYLRMTPEDNELSREHYLRAIELDSDFARAYAGMALTWSREVMDGWTTDPENALAEASSYVAMAEAIDPTVPQIHFVKGMIHLFRGQHLEAAEAAHQAIKLDANYADGYGLLAWVLQNGGRPDVAADALHEAVRLKPESSASFEVIAGEIHFTKGRYQEAAACFRNALDRNPTHSRARIWLVASLAQADALDDARWELDELLAQNPDFSFERTAFGLPQKDPEVLSRFFRALGRVRRLD
jgi:DNA-binding winged helix-turn-helix (wHTH) protein/tetratricopeptide (TPR) repeat protein